MLQTFFSISFCKIQTFKGINLNWTSFNEGLCDQTNLVFALSASTKAYIVNIGLRNFRFGRCSGNNWKTLFRLTNLLLNYTIKTIFHFTSTRLMWHNLYNLTNRHEICTKSATIEQKNVECNTNYLNEFYISISACFMEPNDYTFKENAFGVILLEIRTRFTFRENSLFWWLYFRNWTKLIVRFATHNLLYRNTNLLTCGNTRENVAFLCRRNLIYLDLYKGISEIETFIQRWNE